MIRIIIEEFPVHTVIKLKGHANYNVVGQDIVCAGISTLFQTLCISVEELTKDKFKTSLKAGNAYLAVYKPGRKSQTLMGAFYIGCNEIASLYGDYVEIRKIAKKSEH